jgi:hypothetical protein
MSCTVSLLQRMATCARPAVDQTSVGEDVENRCWESREILNVQLFIEKQRPGTELLGMF